MDVFHHNGCFSYREWDPLDTEERTRPFQDGNLVEGSS